MTNPVIDSTHYKFVEKDGQEISYVKLIGENEWNGTVFQYGKLKVNVDAESNNEYATLSFNYNIIESPLREDMLQEDTNFKNYIGDVLQHIISSALDSGEYRIGPENTDNGTEELDKQ
jgi:hypothetical protein